MHERQRQQLDGLNQKLVALQGAPVTLTHFERLSDLEAVLRHRRAVSHLIAFPIALDFAVPILALIFLSLLRTRGLKPTPLHDKLPPALTYETPSAKHRLAQIMARGRRPEPGPTSSHK